VFAWPDINAAIKLVMRQRLRISGTRYGIIPYQRLHWPGAIIPERDAVVVAILSHPHSAPLFTHPLKWIIIRRVATARLSRIINRAAHIAASNAFPPIALYDRYTRLLLVGSLALASCLENAKYD
jgi:hypothetical protein